MSSEKMMNELSRAIIRNGAKPREYLLNVDDYNSYFVAHGWPRMDKVPGTCVRILDGVPGLLDLSWVDDEE